MKECQPGRISIGMPGNIPAGNFMKVPREESMKVSWEGFLLETLEEYLKMLEESHGGIPEEIPEGYQVFQGISERFRAFQEGFEGFYEASRFLSEIASQDV